MPRRKIILGLCLICSVSSGSRAQQPPRTKPAGDASHAPQPVAPPPKPADDGPSLEVTMKFIQDKLSNLGPIKYSTSGQDEDGRNFHPHQWIYEYTNVAADPQRCTISYHDQGSTDDGKPYSYDFVNLKETEKITVKSLEQDVTDQSGNTEKWTVRPPIFTVYVHTRGKGNKRGGYFIVDDEELANRLGRAIAHAVELCTPEKKPEPF